MAKGAAGSGSVDRLPSGKWRARITVANGERQSLGVFATEDEARAVLDAALAKLASSEFAAVGGMTLRGYGEKWLAQRELVLRSPRAEANKWKKHVATAHFANWPLGAITKRDVQEWLDGLFVKRTADVYQGDRKARRLSPMTVRDVVKVFRVAMRDAVERDYIKSSPATGIRLPKRAVITEPWTYLTPEEQEKLLAVVPLPERCIVAFAMGTGLRKQEQWNLRLADVHLEGDDPHVVVRYGTKGGGTKSGKIRRVPLFGVALHAMRAWVPSLPAYMTSKLGKKRYRNNLGLAFPSQRGFTRDEYAVTGWAKWLDAAALGKHVRWHDLRHTCASSLVAGWWGRPWRLEEVRDMLGHSSITVTERYAHLAQSVVKGAARETNDAWVTQRSQVVQPAEIPHVDRDFLKLRSQVRLLPGALVFAVNFAAN